MSEQVYIFEATENNFQSTVLENSSKLPVFVEFMGVWSEPCFIMETLFSSLAKEFSGKFIFAKVDIDEQPELKKQFRIENVPTLIVFKNGELTQKEEGELKELEARALLTQHGIAHQSDILRDEARTKHLAGDTPGAIMLLTQAIQEHPSNTRVAMDMVQIFLDIGNLENAEELFSRLPAKDKDSEMGKALSGQLSFMSLAAKTVGIEALQEKVTTSPDDYSARFDLAICQTAGYLYDEAMQNLFFIIQKEPTFKEGAAREMIITIIKMLSPVNPEQARIYQRKLDNLLAS